MRTLILLRGAAGCGKSTWIEENGLKQYTLSPDDLRLLCQSPVMKADGTETISQDNDGIVWRTLFRLLETRMNRGEFTVIDATHSVAAQMNRYKELGSKYKYRLYCVDFTDIPIDEVKRRNAAREPYKRVPDTVIDTMYARFATQKVPSGIKVIRPDEINSVYLKMIDLSHYRRIHHIGDLHGCYTVLQEYLAAGGGIREDEYYIFTGDYIDRGVENAEVIEFLFSVMDRKNVLLLEGNHEKWLWLYADEKSGSDKEFELITRSALDDAKIDKKKLRILYRKFGQCAYYRYGEKRFLITHAGLSTLPDNLSFVGTEQMTEGVGTFHEAEKVAQTFLETTPKDLYQIFGHRNPKQLPMQINDRVYDLEGGVEYGGNLRCVQVDEDGIHVTETRNRVYRTPEMRKEQTVAESSIADTLIALRADRYIKEMKFGNISSFNFTDEAFLGKNWNERTIRARGLYIDTVKGKVAARSYQKFFNIDERPETRLEALQRTLKFPVTAYVKENGYLGMVSYDEYTDDLFIACKSTTDSRFAQWFSDMLHEKLPPENLAELVAYVKENKVTFVFECVDMENDPHIIAYPESGLYLLDIVRNDMQFSKYPYDELQAAADRFGLVCKEKAYVLATWQEFYDWYFAVLDDDYRYNGRQIEGFVIEDSEGFCVKLKTGYYRFWKFMRSVAHETVKNGFIKDTAVLSTPTANGFYAWIKKRREESTGPIPRDICTLRREYYEANAGKTLHCD